LSFKKESALDESKLTTLATVNLSKIPGA
jgi:hypothetical protein